MPEAQPIEVSHKGEDYRISVAAFPDGFVRVICLNTIGGSERLPPMTPFEASILARDLLRAAELADQR